MSEDLVNFVQRFDPQYSLISIELLKGKIKNPIDDIKRGRAEKRIVLNILEMIFKMGFIHEDEYFVNRIKIDKI